MVKTKKKNFSEVTQQKHIQQKKKSLNPFEVHINKDKQKVLGRKSKADRGLPGVSRAKAINKRKETLLQEYKLKNKDNVFLDKRIGERNFNMTIEDKAMARFTAERIKAHKKKNIYSLNDEEVLTHKGQTLEEIEKFDDPRSDDEFSDEDRNLDKDFVDEAHFGGGVLSKPDSVLSRKDLIDQLIAESKKRKAEKQKIREQTIDLTEKLDSEWRDLLPVMSVGKTSTEDSVDKTKADDYDIAVRQLKFEARGNPTDKLKSEEELMKEEKEKLEALEADRLARMKGFIDDFSKEIKHKSADDLDDGFVLQTIKEEMQLNNDEISNKQIFNVNEDENTSENDSDNDSQIEDTENHIKNVTNDNDEDDDQHEDFELGSNIADNKSENSEEDNLSDLKESDSSSEEENETKPKKTVKFANNLVMTQKLNDESQHNQLKSIMKTKKETANSKPTTKEREQEIRNDLLKRKEIMEIARKELPYTYSVPESFEELHKLLQDQSPEYQSVIVDRIIKCNHWSLDKQNKEKLSQLFMFLLQHICDKAVNSNTETVINCFQIFDRLCPYLYDLAHVNTENAKNCVQQIIKERHDEFEKNMKHYPKLDTLIMFKLVSLLFPTSDFRHTVVTPCLVFMSQILLRCRVRNRKDISRGLFICTLILEYTTLCKRFSPAVINFLRGIVFMATPKHLIKGIKVIPPFKIHGDLSDLLIMEHKQKHLDIDTNAVNMKACDLIEEEIENEFKTRALLTTLNLIMEFKTHLEELEAAYSIFEPIIKLLVPHSFKKYPIKIRERAIQLREELESLKNKKLEYLVLQKKRPKPLKLYEPRIETIIDGKKHKPMSKEKAEREKLLHKYKKEMKGAIREIRRDREFLTKLQIKQQLKSDEERKRKVKEIFGEAAQQQSELKKFKKK